MCTLIEIFERNLPEQNLVRSYRRPYLSMCGRQQCEYGLTHGQPVTIFIFQTLNGDEIRLKPSNQLIENPQDTTLHRRLLNELIILLDLVHLDLVSAIRP